MNNPLVKKRLEKWKEQYKRKFPDVVVAWGTLGLFPLVCFYILVPNDSLAMNIFSHYLGIFIVPLEFILEDLMGLEKGSNEWGIPQFIIVPYLSGLALYHVAYGYYYLVIVADLLFDKNSTENK